MRGFIDAYRTVEATPDKDWERLPNAPAIQLVLDLKYARIAAALKERA